MNHSKVMRIDMGGGGTSLPFKYNPEELAKEIRKVESETENAIYEAEINRTISEQLIKINQRDTDQIAKRLNEIKKTLEKEIDGALDIRYGGSVAKHTYVDGLSDIDTLFLLNNSELSDKTPKEVKEYFARMLGKKYENSEVRIGRLAVTITFKDKTEIQILPAIKTNKGYRIQSAVSEDKWTKIEPQAFMKALRYVNIKMQGKLIPVIKLAKSIMAQLPEKRRMTGYHTEAVAIEVFKDYNGSKSNKDMLKHFFSYAAKVVLIPIKDRSGQSAHVDGYLGKKNSILRQIVSDALSNLDRKLKNADATANESIWHELLATGE